MNDAERQEAVRGFVREHVGVNLGEVIELLLERPDHDDFEILEDALVNDDTLEKV